jgi:transmembrane sensor
MSNFQFKYRASELILKRLRDELTPEEQHELEMWMKNNPSYQSLVEELSDEGKLVENIEEVDGLRLRISAKLYGTIPDATPVIPMFKRSFFRIAVAASIIILIGLGGYFLFYNSQQKKVEIVNVPALKDVEAPKATRAVITLADGRQISIDSLNTFTQGNVQVSKTSDGKIIYNGSAKEVIYNTLTNPRGSKVIDMTLADGSHVWLNAGSSVTYPVAFVGNQRKVSIIGEAYFEIAYNSTMPFFVSKGDVQVQVLGTHFNVNAYDDEIDIKVTLLEGSVEVRKGSSSGLLKPGQQAKITTEVKILNNVDLQQVMAWKDGNFKYSRTDLKVIMREIGRWYDVEVIYEGNIPVQLYNVGVPRTANVSEVLKGLEYTGAHFSVEGKKIIVRP